MIAIALTLPYFQTKIGTYFTAELNKKYNININVDAVSVTVFGGIKLRKVLILDHHKDTLIYANRIKTSILDYNKLISADLIFGDLAGHELYLNMRTYKNEKETNLDRFVRSFDTREPPSGKHFLMTVSKVDLTDSRFSLIDDNLETKQIVDFKNIDLSAVALRIFGSEVSTTINELSLLDHSGIEIEALKTKFSYTNKQIRTDNLYLKTKNSEIKGTVILNYQLDDFLRFTDKVVFDVLFDEAVIGSNDIHFFYDELAKNKLFKIKGNVDGPLNNLVLSNFNLNNSSQTQLIGSINFKNLFPSGGKEFYMNGSFKKLSTNYEDLVATLPNVLGRSLPKELKKFGKVDIVGNTVITTKHFEGKLRVNSQLGKIDAKIDLQNIDNLDSSSYKGTISLDDFNLGSLLDRKDLGKTSLDLNVAGSGFSNKTLQTSVVGNVKSLLYNNYNYQNIKLNGSIFKGLYTGIVTTNDPNLALDFDGSIDTRASNVKYDFGVKIGKAYLNKLGITNDKISNFSGDVRVIIQGKSIDDFVGAVSVYRAQYQNTKETYTINDFNLKSSFDNNRVRTVSISSTDILNGQIVGKFQFGQLYNIIKNALGSLYKNYKPVAVKKGQFLTYDFSIENKVIEIFFPGISIATNTNVNGTINSDENDFKLNLNSPKITAPETSFENIRLKIDNKNSIYNAYVELDTIRTKFYKISDFSLINIIAKDTLLFRTEFNGGQTAKDNYKLNLYHTLDQENNHRVGFRRSEIKRNDYIWVLNDDQNKGSQILIDKSFESFSIDNIFLTHENQQISIGGQLRGTDYKDLNLTFKDVDLKQIAPEDPDFVLDGKVDASIRFKQLDEIYQIPADIKISNLTLNNTSLGNLKIEIVGDDKLRKFDVKAEIENENVNSISVHGYFEVVSKNTQLDLVVNLDQFNLAVLEPLGGDVVSNINGFVSGSASITGAIHKPEINGRVYLEKSRLKIPYLNTTYALGERSIVDLTTDKFLFRNIILSDTKYGSAGNLMGTVKHTNFSDWKLDLNIRSKKLLVLDTKDSEEAAYFGTAFIDGVASIKGPANALFIKVDAKSKRGTSIKIPINNSNNVAGNDFIHFITKSEKFNLTKVLASDTRNYQGLELEFDLDITPDAEVEVILDRNDGHGMKGKGNGTLLMKINTLGKFNMWGDFQAYEGFYNFKYKGLIDKKFIVKKGGYISWEGDPMKARLNLEAIYKTAANPSVLLGNSAFNKKVDVNVTIGIKGDLASPEPDFSFDFPSVSTVLKNEIDYKLVDKDVRQTQALYLLSTGGFVSSEGINQATFSQSAFDTASSLLSGMIKSNDEKFQVNIGIVGSDNVAGQEVDGRFVASISSKLNERITINGKVGVPFGGISQTAVVGDVEVLYRVNEDGTVNLRFFNRENDLTYIGEGVGYTQGIGVSYEVDFDTFNELVVKIFKKNIVQKTSKSKIIEEDSIEAPINKDPAKPTDNNPTDFKPNSDGRVPEED